MASLHMNGPYPLTEEGVDSHVMSSIPGNFALGTTKNSVFYVKFIGRADDCLSYRLKNLVGKYDVFKFSYALSVKDAFEKQCKFFHEFGAGETLDNPSHPVPPENFQLQCPHCGK